ncbi:MAG: hypothetical protein WC052_05125 [Patescibacteria group bacterium]
MNPEYHADLKRKIDRNFGIVKIWLGEDSGNGAPAIGFKITDRDKSDGYAIGDLRDAKELVKDLNQAIAHASRYNHLLK